MENRASNFTSNSNDVFYRETLKKVEYIYGLRNDDNVKIALDFAETLEKEGQLELANGVLELCEELYMEPFKMSSTIYYEHIMPVEPSFVKYNPYSNCDKFREFLGNRQVTNCGEYARFVLDKILEINAKSYKKHGKILFPYCVGVGAYPDHAFNLIITDDNRIIFIDSWNKNLICDFTPENLARFGSLCGLRKFKLVRFDHPERGNKEYQKDYQIKLPTNYNPFKLPLDKIQCLENRFLEIESEFSTNKELQQIMINRANEDIRKISEYTNTKQNGKYYYSNRLVANLEVFRMISSYYSRERDKVIPANSFDEYGVMAMITPGCKSFSALNKIFGEWNQGALSAELICKSFVLDSMEEALTAIEESREKSKSLLASLR